MAKQKSRKTDDPEQQFGIIAVRKNFITPQDLIDGYLIQAQEEEEKEERRRIGDILAHLGLSTKEQVEDGLQVQIAQKDASRKTKRVQTKRP
jgi:hypothetical protein